MVHFARHVWRCCPSCARCSPCRPSPRPRARAMTSTRRLAACRRRSTKPNGSCDARRPVPEIRTLPATPRAGGTVALVASSPGRGLTFAWDLDDDGAFDDGNGATLTRSFPAGTRRVRVRATDEDGRAGESTLTVQLHAGNLAPTGSVGLEPEQPADRPAADGLGRRRGPRRRDHPHRSSTLTATAPTRSTSRSPPVPRRGRSARSTFAAAGERTLRARFTDDGGAGGRDRLGRRPRAATSRRR